MEALFLDPTLILLIAAFAGFFMAFGIGANDVANAMGTSVGSKAITFKQAILIAAVFEFLGAYLAGGEVTSTIRKGIVDPDLYVGQENIFIIGMMSALLQLQLGALQVQRLACFNYTLNCWIYCWLCDRFCWVLRSIMGKVGTIAASWVTSPVFAGTFSFFIYLSAKKFILDRRDPSQAAVSLIPIYSFFVAIIIALVTARKGLKHVGLPLSDSEVLLVTVIFGVVVSIITAILLRLNSEKIREYGVESAFAILMIVTASAMAFAHGSNDVANAIGPMSAIISVTSEGAIGAKSAVSPYVLLIGGAGIVFGLAMLGGRVIKTVGTKITTLTPSLGFSAEMAAASTVVAATYIGFPISTTHTLVGAVIGVGLAKGVSHLDYSSIGRIILSWLVTIPVGTL